MLLISLIGLAAAILCIPLMFREVQLRRDKAIRLMHTKFVALNSSLEPIHLMSTDLIIGRWTRRCDISLAGLNQHKKGKQGNKHEEESPISRVHAELWWDGVSFRIAPVYTRRLNGEWSRPKVWVNMRPAPEGSGLPVDYGDTITLSDAGYRFRLENTSKERTIKAKSAKSPGGRNRLSVQLQTGAGRLFGGIGKKKQSRSGKKPRSAKRPGAKKKTPVSGKRIHPLGVLAVLAVAVAVLVGLVLGAMEMPQAESSLGRRKKDTATVLVCGVDEHGERTDTMLLVYLSGSERRMSLLSLPRDTISVSKRGNTVKLNAIYGGNGQEGAEDLLDVVESYIGYRPDGYLFFDWALVKEITDLMGGVTVTLEQEVAVWDPDVGGTIHVPAGENHLNGEQTLAAVRFRSGYQNADLGRIQVQRKVLKACKDQWVDLKNIGLLDDAIDLLLERSLTDLTTKNFIWLAKTALNCEDTSISETLEGYAEYRDGVSYYFLSPRDIAAQINENFNPYRTEVTREMIKAVE